MGALRGGLRYFSVMMSLALGLALSACGTGKILEEDKNAPVVYLTHRAALTTNAGSLEGRSTDASLISARLFPGTTILGPGGQLLPNSDLISADIIQDDPKTIHYSIKREAVFSDGHPITCDDFFLTYTAASMPITFGSALPLFNNVDHMECASGAKDFKVTFKPGYGQRWHNLFSSGTVLPSHAIAKEAGIDSGQLYSQMKNSDPDELRAVAQVWRHGFDIGSFNPRLQLSSGPYKIKNVEPNGDIHLVANEKYYGNPPELPELDIRPGNRDTSFPQGSTPFVLDLADGNADIVPRDDDNHGVDIHQLVGDRIDTLSLAKDGVFAEPAARKAFNACIDKPAVGRASSDISGIKVPWVSTRVTSHTNPLYSRISATVDGISRGDKEQTEALKGKTVRVAYHGPNKRYQAMVEAIRSSCSQAGITVEDVSTDSTTLASMVNSDNSDQGFVDAFLYASYPEEAFDIEPADKGKRNSLAKTEASLWQDIPTIPLAAEPRIIAFDRRLGNVVDNTGPTGIGWNVDRWRLDNTD